MTTVYVVADYTVTPAELRYMADGWVYVRYEGETEDSRAMFHLVFDSRKDAVAKALDNALSDIARGQTATLALPALKRDPDAPDPDDEADEDPDSTPLEHDHGEPVGALAESLAGVTDYPTPTRRLEPAGMPGLTESPFHGDRGEGRA